MVGAGAVIGDQSQVRERARDRRRARVVGRGSAVDNDVTIGDRVRIQTGCYITACSVIEDDVFVAPGVTLTNDDTMGRHGPVTSCGERPCGGRAGWAGAPCSCPGVEVGEEAFVAAGAVVTADVPARAVVMGVPARLVREVRRRRPAGALR